MASDGLSDAEIAGILIRNRRVALVGASSNPSRPSYGVMGFMIGRGYDVAPVNPGLAGQDLLGQEVFARLADVPGRIDMVDVFRRSEEVGHVVQQPGRVPRPSKCNWQSVSNGWHAAEVSVSPPGLARIPHEAFRRLTQGVDVPTVKRSGQLATAEERGETFC